MTVLALAGLALTGMSASGATAAPGRLLAGDAVSRMVSDGTRFAAFEPRVGVLRVLDAFDGSEGTTRDLALPAGCDTRFDVGGPVAVGGGVALLQCGQSGYWPSAQVLDLATGAVVATIGRAQLDGRLDSTILDSQWSEVGSQWAVLTYGGNHFQGEAALNWHTGEIRDLGYGDRTSATSALDLDAPGLTAPLCAPLRRRPWVDPYTTTDRWLPLAYEAPFAVGPERIGGPLFAWRCGSRTGSRIGPDAMSLQLAAGLASYVPRAWNGSRPVFAYDLAAGTSYRWDGLPEGMLGPISVAQTAAGLFTSSWLSAVTDGRIPNVGTYEIRVISRPRPQLGRDARARLAAGRVAVPLRWLTARDPASGAVATYRPAGPVAGGDELRLTPGRPLAITPAARARAVRWRLIDRRGRGLSRLRSARRAGSEWVVALPARVPGRSRALLLDILYSQGRALFRAPVRVGRPARRHGSGRPARTCRVPHGQAVAARTHEAIVYTRTVRYPKGQGGYTAWTACWRSSGRRTKLDETGENPWSDSAHPGPLRFAGRFLAFPVIYTGLFRDQPGGERLRPRER